MPIRYPYILPTVQAAFRVHRDRDLFALSLSCGHTNMYVIQPPFYMGLDTDLQVSVGCRSRCYKKHDQDGIFLPSSLDPQQEASEHYFFEGKQCMACGGIEGVHTMPCVQAHPQRKED